MPSTKLSPCHFCGSAVIERERHSLGGERYVWCPGCGVAGPQHSTHADAAAAWNKTRTDGALSRLLSYYASLDATLLREMDRGNPSAANLIGTYRQFMRELKRIRGGQEDPTVDWEGDYDE